MIIHAYDCEIYILLYYIYSALYSCQFLEGREKLIPAYPTPQCFMFASFVEFGQSMGRQTSLLDVMIPQ